MIIVTGYVYLPPAELTPFLDDLAALTNITRQRTGNISYDTAVIDLPSGKLLITERWADQAALSNHLKAPDTGAFINKWGNHMQSDVQKYDGLNERDLMEN
ncbi:putative quinol monooxygenase [Tatumella sp. UBA2305]|uniref:putative quinol monooxygenase n=1 Tax=Tatumella sp. UBA2305 TaxID=1947647 RepID=UPI0025D2F091|nr:antibiotic biosynthesis monooxygenase [Tatumella sp. UBA2305]